VVSTLTMPFREAGPLHEPPVCSQKEHAAKFALIATPDPELDLNYTPNTAVTRPVRTVLSNSFGFGGHNVTLAVKRFEE